ncbi:uncharacterized protein BO80DRAFT_73862 [Aspergillus ibericus CBS 121593]|uniref:Uncharacterized protein n=1 Tax=Aspergillus ibericus CBS 121593 TaxID=1448316 RepID=A0A395HF15_9EURO|nr:hypothetical protein BO80DRAFT_73862 [Aspergillus ibericus CBS 121593]RAL05588.1 hypothetical protein BO80DRAFT_73862 [Aspergillus ibericus CBS 121593]
MGKEGKLAQGGEAVQKSKILEPSPSSSSPAPPPSSLQHPSLYSSLPFERSSLPHPHPHLPPSPGSTTIHPPDLSTSDTYLLLVIPSPSTIAFTHPWSSGAGIAVVSVFSAGPGPFPDRVAHSRLGWACVSCRILSGTVNPWRVCWLAHHKHFEPSQDSSQSGEAILPFPRHPSISSLHPPSPSSTASHLISILPPNNLQPSFSTSPHPGLSELIPSADSWTGGNQPDA